MYLNISHATVSNKEPTGSRTLSAIADMKSLSHLIVQSVHYLIYDNLSTMLSNKAALQVLDLSACAAKFIEAFPLPSLRSLSITHGVVDISCLAGYTTLTELNLSGSRVVTSEPTLAMLADLSLIKVLNLEGLPFITDNAQPLIVKQFPALENLNVRRTKISIGRWLNFGTERNLFEYRF